MLSYTNIRPVAVVAIVLNIATVASAAMPFDAGGRSIVAQFHAEGAQIYECKPSADGKGSTWTFREPIATLIENGKTVGRHYAGPHWALDDGSIVQGRQSQSLPGATASDIPQLKLDVVSHGGHGILDQANVVYRLNTHLGTLKGDCSDVGALRAVAYSADYIFAK
jgi:hypothetical protein